MADITCFDWQNRASDYVDGSLLESEKKEADDHLATCEKCQERYKHYRMILTSIASQPRSALPVPIRKSPFTAALPRIGPARWEHVPWYIRTAIEGAAIVFMILLGISVGPRLRAVYEKGVEQSLSEFTQSFQNQDKDSAAEKVAAAIPLTRGKAAVPAAEGDEFMSGEGDTPGDDDDDAESSSTVVDESQDIRVGSSEIWRFIIKTSSPHEVRPRIVQMLTSMRVGEDTPGLGGIEAPGGIQFDLLVPQSIVPALKRQLQGLAPKAPAELADTPAGETFTWYKNRSRKKLPERKTRIVIWLSQM